MKKLVLFFGVFFLLLSSLQSQAPQKFNYQAVPRLVTGDLLPGQPVKVRFVLSEDGPSVVKYAEEQTVTTSVHGVLSAAIGDGGVTGGFPHDFSVLDWSQHQYYLAVSLDLNGNGSFENNEVFSNNQLLSVPYALYAAKAGDTGTVDNDTDPTNEFQQLSLSGNTISLSNGGGSVILPPSVGTDSQILTLAGNTLGISNGNTVTLPAEVDGSITNEIQQLSLSNGVVSLTGGGNVTLPDASPTNEIQTLSINGNAISLSPNGGTVNLPPVLDASPTNEIQELSINGNVISLSNNGGSVTLPPTQGSDPQTLILAGNALSISNGNTVNLPAEVDGSVTNEIQQLSLANGVVSLTGGGNVVLPDASPTNEIQELSINGDVISLSNNGGSITLPPNQGTDSQTLMLVGNTLSISNGNTVNLPAEVDGSVTNEIQELSINGNAISLSNNGGTVNLPPEVDGSVTNEIQELSINGNAISLSNNGGTVNLPAEVDGSVTNEIQELSINGNAISLSNNGGTVNLPAEVDGSITNEIQQLSLANGVVSLTDGGSVVLPDDSPTNEIQQLMLNGTQLSLTNGGGTVALPASNSIVAGTGIAVTTVLNTTTVSALNTSDIWNANLLRGRPIDGMAPNPGFVMAYSNDTDGWVSYDNDLNITAGGKLEVAALRGRPIDGMAPNPGFVMAYKNDTDGWVSYDNDLNVTAGGKLEVAALRGRPIDGMAPNPGFVMAFKDTINGWVSYANDLSINNDRLEVAQIRGLNVNMANLGPNKALTCMTGSDGLEFQCVDLTTASFPLNYNGSSSTPLISITNSNTTNNNAVNVTNGGQYSIIGSTSKGDQLPILINEYYDPAFTYPAGIRGLNTNSTREGTGVSGSSISPPNQNGVGVGGFFQGGWIGAVGIGYRRGTAGVVGIKQARTNSSKENQWAIYGETDDENWAYAGYFKGDVKVTGDLYVNGTVSKSGGSFRIDHPLDPANKYLYHSFVESPDMKNIYDGVTTTDANGFATVELPSYFQELNKDFRYQLTCIGTFAQAIISKKVDGNQFQIQTDKPGVEVSWQVTGIRKDPYAEAHRIEVEVEKTGFEKGKYTHPELYGQPESLKIAQKLTRH